MKIKQVRNATLLVEYAGKTFLVDPMLAEKGAYPGFEGTVNSEQRNPLVDLTVPMDEILDVDAVIVTHTHPDHWDDAARNLVPKDLPLFAQNEQDATDICAAGFGDTRVLAGEVAFEGITLSKTPGRHGSDEAYAAMGAFLGEVCGVVFRHPDEKTLYVAGDTIWNEEVARTIERYAPDVIVLNCGDAQVVGIGAILMGKEDVVKASRAAPAATIVASHMEAVNHCVLSRTELREFANANSLTQHVWVPEDGEAADF